MTSQEKKPKFNSVMVVDDLDVDLFIAEKTFSTQTEVNAIYLEKNGASALKFLKSIKKPEDIPELIILDVRMPGMNVFKFVKEFEIITQRKCCNSRIFLVSAFFDYEEEVIMKARKYPIITKCIRKPFKSEYLV